MIEISKQYLPQLSCGFSDPRVHVHIQDGKEFMAQYNQEFDVIITDSSDPVGEKGERVITFLSVVFFPTYLSGALKSAHISYRMVV